MGKQWSGFVAWWGGSHANSNFSCILKRTSIVSNSHLSFSFLCMMKDYRPMHSWSATACVLFQVSAMRNSQAQTPPKGPRNIFESHTKPLLNFINDSEEARSLLTLPED
jgi:hypothetical protein